MTGINSVSPQVAFTADNDKKRNSSPISAGTAATIGGVAGLVADGYYGGSDSIPNKAIERIKTAVAELPDNHSLKTTLNTAKEGLEKVKTGTTGFFKKYLGYAKRFTTEKVLEPIKDLKIEDLPEKARGPAQKLVDFGKKAADSGFVKAIRGAKFTIIGTAAGTLAAIGYNKLKQSRSEKA